MDVYSILYRSCHFKDYIKNAMKTLQIALSVLNDKILLLTIASCDDEQEVLMHITN